MTGSKSQPEPAPPSPAPADWTHAEPPEAVAAAPLEDEGTAPLRHPSIDIDQPLVPARDVVVTIDLLRGAVTHTQGGPVIVGQLDADWQTLDLTVHLQCAALEFVNGSPAIVTINRNAASTPAKLKARVRADAARLPLGIVLYVMGAPMRRRARRNADALLVATPPDPAPAATGAVVGRPGDSRSIPQSDAGGQASGDAVAPERKEP